VVEKDEKTGTNTGVADNQTRLQVMSKCFLTIKDKKIGPGSNKNNFFLSGKKLSNVIIDIFDIRKETND